MPGPNHHLVTPAPSNEALSLLSTLLSHSLGRTGARAAAEAALSHYGSLRALCRLPINQLARLPGWNTRAAQLLQTARALVQRQQEEQLLRGIPLTSPAETLAYLRTALGDRRREIFCCLFLDTRHRVIASEELFKGSIDGACVYPRVVAERALLLGAAAVIVAHNHPSGIAEPSLADQAITRRLREALGLLDIRLLDHFVIGDGAPVSLASRGLL